VSGGIAYEAPFGRKHDLAAIAVVWSRPSPLSGLRDETLVELFYRIEVVKAVSISPDLQVVFDPSNNPGDDVVFVPGIRLHVRF
jgi:carbohydrate-selective porin OprB